MKPTNLSTLTAHDLAHFRHQGYLRLPGAFPHTLALAMQDVIWSRLREFNGIERADRGTWDRPWRDLNHLDGHPIFGDIASPRLLGAIDDLMGAGRWKRPRDWGQFLVSPPDAPSPPGWTVPADGWHWDRPPSRGLAIFTFMGQVDAHGGGTLFLGNSRHLLEPYLLGLTPEERRLKPNVLRRRFRHHHPYLKRLNGLAARATPDGEEFMHQQSDSDGTPLQIIEAIGAPGDALICQSCIYHVKPPHLLPAPRIMRLKFIAEVGDEALRHRARESACPGDMATLDRSSKESEDSEQMLTDQSG